MMRLFCCEVCKGIDAVEIAYPRNNSPDQLGHGKWTCTQCKKGTWHNYFEFKLYDPKKDIVVNKATGLGLE